MKGVKKTKWFFIVTYWEGTYGSTGNNEKKVEELFLEDKHDDICEELIENMRKSIEKRKNRAWRELPPSPEFYYYTNEVKDIEILQVYRCRE